MKTIFKLTLKSAVRDPFLFFWSILLPVTGAIGLGMLFNSSEYPRHILTGMMAVSILFYSFMTTAYSILVQRRRGVYHLLRITPLPLWKYIYSISSAWTLTSVLCGMVVLLAGGLVFGIDQFVFAALLVIPIIFLAAIGYVFLSFFVASLTRTEGNLSMITSIGILPFLFCSNAFYSLAGAPQWIQTISRFNPFQWFVDGLRSSLALDWPNYFINIGLLFIVGTVTFVLALRTFRYADV
ncbi:ABC transporter permease [Paenibacillus apis]|uniref:Transport permease protein n=1 Tax=Paenibacillus apis TaxID=1792174 RepID=A0A919Y2K4_9BACL|nr:ABC transporter permease [Paenibacillus apis]GIO41148.1 ABC transporter [Paenibacillus apis]